MKRGIQAASTGILVLLIFQISQMALKAGAQAAFFYAAPSRMIRLMKNYQSKHVRRTLNKYPLSRFEVEISIGHTLELVGIVDPYELLEQMIEKESINRDERFPYWAELWPSSLGLARWFCTANITPAPHRVLELGCGLGLLGIVLARLGWWVEATDFVEDALIFTTYNALKNQVAGRHQVAYLDWRNPVGETCEFMVAADVAYEKKNHPHLARVLRHRLAPGGWFYLADPRRPTARGFCELLESRGYSHQIDSCRTKWKSLEHAIDIHIFQKPEVPI